jgi:hypothetical protein
MLIYENTSNDDMAACPNCGDDFERLGLHWFHGTCPYPQLDREQTQLLTGVLMGDGSIPRTKDNEVFRLPMINRRFLRWFDEQMGVMTTGLRIKKTATELARLNRESGFSPRADAEQYHDIYTVWTRTHPYVTKLREWYDSGEKRFPADLELTSRVAAFWYACDGYLDFGDWGRPRAGIKARNEQDRGAFLESLFDATPISPQYQRHELRFSCDDTERLIDWLGDPPPGFEYKWTLDSQAQYREYKRRAYESYATRNGE